jgi:hypothetical protein
MPSEERNVPLRDFHVMHPQPIVAWTLALLAKALGAWLMEEEHYDSYLGSLKKASAKQGKMLP